MTFYEFSAQAIGIVAMAFNILSYQNKKQKSIIAFQFFGSILFAVSFFMLKAYVGAILNIVAFFRAIVFLNREKFHAEKPVWILVFVLLFFSSYILTFTVFDTPWNWFSAVIELLPILGVTATTIGFHFKDAATVRKFSLICSPMWLIYNGVNIAIGGFICEALSLVSIVVGMFRHDRNN